MENNKKDLQKADNSKKITEFLAKQLNKKIELITPDKRVVEDLGADSLDIVELLMVVEEMFGVTIPDADAMKLKTVGDVIDYVNKNI